MLPGNRGRGNSCFRGIPGYTVGIFTLVESHLRPCHLPHFCPTRRRRSRLPVERRSVAPQPDPGRPRRVVAVGLTWGASWGPGRHSFSRRQRGCKAGTVPQDAQARQPVRGGGAHVFAGGGNNQIGLLGGERPAVPVHEPLAGAGVLHVKVGKKRHHFRPHGHGMSFRRTEWPPGGGGAGGCRSCGFWQPARVQYNDPAVNRRWWTRPHNGQATGAPDKSHCPAVALMTHALPAAAARQRSLQPTQTARRESRRNAPLVSIS
jgi:hypothetical protein